MPLSYTEGYKKFKNKVFKVSSATVAPYKPKISIKTNIGWDEIINTDSLYLDVLYHGALCDENGNKIRDIKQIFKIIRSTLKLIFWLALILIVAYLVWKKFRP